MAIPLVIPLLAGVGLLATILVFGEKSASASELPEGLKKEASVETKKELAKSIKEKDWQKAVADAIASRSIEAMQIVAEALKKAGKHAEAEALLGVIRDFRDLEKSAPKAKPVVSKPASLPAKSAPKPAPKPQARPVSTTKPKPKAKPKPAPKPEDPKKRQARELVHIMINGTEDILSDDVTRATAPKAKIADYQRANGLVADGLYGPATARTLFNLYNLVPPNPLHWPANNAQAAVNAYSKFLDEVVKAKPESANRIASMKKVLGR